MKKTTRKTTTKPKQKLMNADEWISVFHEKTCARTGGLHNWCDGSLRPKTEEKSDTCEYCGKDMVLDPRRQNVDKSLHRVHLKTPSIKGLYLIHLGAVNGYGDWCKIGSSEKMIDRLFTHLRDRLHEKVEVLHVTGRNTNWKTTEGVEGLIVGRLREVFPSETRLYEEYFPYSREFTARTIALMNAPKLLVGDLLDGSQE